MAVLSAEDRKKLKPEQFVFPESRKYPVPDVIHGRAALQMVAKHGSPEEKAAVRRKVCSLYPDIASCNTKKYESPLK